MILSFDRKFHPLCKFDLSSISKQHRYSITYITFLPPALEVTGFVLSFQNEAVSNGILRVWKSLAWEYTLGQILAREPRIYLSPGANVN